MKSRYLAHLLTFTLLTTAVSAGEDILPLAGTWRFALDRTAEQTDAADTRYGDALPVGAGVTDEWFKRELPEKIQLPGVLQAQGYGNDISPTTPWVLGLGDAWWKLQPAELRERFSQPGKVEVPFLSQPPKHYLGAAWYQRDVEIPSDWQGRRFELFLERAHWETRVWVDDKSYGSCNSLVAPHVFDLGVLAPGRHRLTIRVDNRRIVGQPGSNGHADDSHSTSDALGATWNGIVGRIEVRSMPPVWIEDAQVFPNAATRSTRVRVNLGNATGKSGNGEITAGGVSKPVQWTAEGATTEIDVPFAAGVRTWDEFNPALQKLTVSLSGDGIRHERVINFGIREVSARGKDLLINGKLVNLRTTHHGGDFPLTGYPATDVESWKKLIRVCQDYGLNGIRFHSWCPPEAAFQAADELGFYLQPECGLWHPLNPGGAYTALLEEETERMLKAFGNHPSFILLSPANEPGGDYVKVTPEWAVRWYGKDSRRLYAAGTGWNRPPQVTGGAQFATLVRYGRGELRNVTGWFGRDHRLSLEDVNIPVFSHEIGQWCAYPDFSVIEKFTGYLQPSNYRIFRYIAEQEGVLEYNALFSRASGLFQLACYKEEIEANLRTPGLAGYQLLDLRDYLGQGTALIGVLDAFWEPKNYVRPEVFRRFNNTTVPLARLAKRVFATSDTLTADTELYHFGKEPLQNVTAYWAIQDNRGRNLIEGKWQVGEQPIGKNLPLGKISAELASLPAPAAYRLVVGLEGLKIENDWKIWVYPAAQPAPAPADVLVTKDWEAAKARLDQGGKVIFTPGEKALDPSRSPPMKRVPIFWNIQMTVRPPQNLVPRFDAMLGLACDPQHPALAGFPTEINCDWQWTQIVHNVPSINLSKAPRELRPIVAAIDDWNRNWRLGVLFECAVGKGRLLVSAVDVTSEDAANLSSLQLRRSLVAYAASDKFKPATRLSVDQLSQLWPGPNSAATAAPGSRRHDPDLDDGSQNSGAAAKKRL